MLHGEVHQGCMFAARGWGWWERGWDPPSICRLSGAALSSNDMMDTTQLMSK